MNEEQIRAAARVVTTALIESTSMTSPQIERACGELIAKLHLAGLLRTDPDLDLYDEWPPDDETVALYDALAAAGACPRRDIVTLAVRDLRASGWGLLRSTERGLLDRLVYALKVQYPSYTEHLTAAGVAAVDEAYRLGYGHRL